MYPIKFNKIYKEKVWGGRNFESLLEMSLPNQRLYGESWEVSSHNNGTSIISNGKFKGLSFSQLIEQFGEDLLGSEVYRKYKGVFPLLIKYLDINDKLSVQVHPDDLYALDSEGEFGKFESWYVIDASEDAELILGISDGITKEHFIKSVANQNFDGLFREVSVKKGDFLDIKTGLVHASLKGSITICEVQQNSDTTYRIYDFDRKVDGVKRELHIDKALDVIDFDMVPEISTEDSRSRIYIDGVITETLSETDYYNIVKVTLKDGLLSEIPYKNFKILSVLSGSGLIEYGESSDSMSVGETLFIPAGLKYTIKGSMEFLKTYI